MAQPQFVNRYSRADRLLHRMAFASPGLQVSLADIEDRLHRTALSQVALDRTVLITALPRAGTTLLLNLLYRTGEFASHTYRHMPFVLCPMLWQPIARRFKTQHEPAMERAHGDGVAVCVDSAEAFEEMVWQPFWAKHYQSDRIKVWPASAHVAFEHFMRNHWRKLIVLAGGDGRRRYVSKNNLNIARLDYLRAQFPDARIVVPFRDPLQHAASLLKQHQRFLAKHKEDAFSRQYMRSIGHHDFGQNLRPIDFDGWLDSRQYAETTELGYWLEYWVAAYRHVLERVNEQVVLLPFDEWMQRPRAGLTWLTEVLDLDLADALMAQSETLRTPARHALDTQQLPSVLVAQARAVFAQLNAHSPAANWQT